MYEKRGLPTEQPSPNLIRLWEAIVQPPPLRHCYIKVKYHSQMNFFAQKFGKFAEEGLNL